MTTQSSNYWDLDIPGLDEVRAREFASLIEQADAGCQVIVSDPRNFLTLRLDRASVLALRDAVVTQLGDGDPSGSPAPLRGLLEDFEEWLSDAPAG